MSFKIKNILCQSSRMEFEMENSTIQTNQKYKHIILSLELTY